jgi:predicted RND superfamily exporter protein
MANYLKFILKHRLLTVTACLMLIALASTGISRLHFIADLRVFFSSENPQLKNLEKFERAFTRMGSVVFIINPASGTVFDKKTLAAITDLTREAWKLPRSSSVSSLTNFSFTRADGDELVVEDLVKNPASLTPADLERIREFAINEPLLRRSLISPDGRVATVSVSISTTENQRDDPVQLALESRALAQKISAAYPGVDVYVSGSEIFNYAFTEVSRDDMELLYPLMFAIMILMMYILLRSVAGVLITLIILASSAFTAMGVAGMVGISLTTASSAAPIIILTVAVADSIHLIISMLFFMRQGMTKNEAIRKSLHVNFQPVFLTSLTTAIGFLSMVTSDSPPFRDLGIIVATGVAAAFFFSVTLLPALLSLLPMGSDKTGRLLPRTWNMDRFADFILDHRRSLLWFMSAILFILALGLPRIELYDKFVEYFDDRYEVRRVTDFLEENMSGLSSIKYLVDSGEEGGINSPAFLARVEKFSNWYLAQPEVVKVSSIIHTVKRLNMNMHGDDPAYYRLPENRELVAQYLLLYEMSLPFGHDLQDSITADHSALSLSVYTRRISTRSFRDLEDRAALWLAENFPPDLQPEATGMVSMFAHISERNIRGMIKSTALALVLISITLVFAFKSLKFGLFSLIPNVVPALMTFGFWGLIVGYVNMAVSYIAAMSLGIVVDDTIHFLSKYLRARRDLGLAPEEAIRATFHSVGMALLTTSIILAAGFAVLFFSGFEVNAVMGILMAIAIVFALLADFFLLPVLLLIIDREPPDRPATP